MRDVSQKKIPPTAAGPGRTGGNDWQDGCSELLIFKHHQTRRLVMRQDVSLSESHCGGAHGVACTWNSFHKPPQGQSPNDTFLFFTTNVLFHYSSFQNITRFHICLLIWAALSCVGQKLWSTICPVIIEFFDYFAEKNHSSEFSPQLNTIRGPGSTDWASLVISFTLLYFYWGKRIGGRWKVNKT